MQYKGFTANMTTLTKQQAFDLFEQKRAELLTYARWVAVKLAFERGTITIDDVREIVKLPDDINPKVFGAVFKTPEFELVGYTKSTRTIAHQRPIGMYRLKPEYRYKKADNGNLMMF